MNLRRLFPPAGPAYELFDCSVFLFVFGFVGYVLFNPPDTTADVLTAPLRLVTEDQLGMLMSYAAAFGVVASYFGWLKSGFVVTIVISLALCLNFLIGVFIAPDDAAQRAGILNCVLYGWVARRLLLEQRLIPRRPG